MIYLGNKNIQGKSGRHYQFEMYEFNTNLDDLDDFDNVDCVYIYIGKNKEYIYHEENLDDLDRIYVGETDNLKERSQQHNNASDERDSDICIQGYDITHIFLCRESNKSKRTAIEDDILKNTDYSWRWNEKGNPKKN